MQAGLKTVTLTCALRRSCILTNTGTFSMYDVDGNGHIDLIEMTKIVKSIYNMMGPSQVAMDVYESPEARAEGIFKRMDINADGRVTRR